jgi:eukaryotic-like serine/threonine-protein kinase
MILMQGTMLQLNKLWKIGERLGVGGFGQVYAATCDGVDAAVKFVRKLPGGKQSGPPMTRGVSVLASGL